MQWMQRWSIVLGLVAAVGLGSACDGDETGTEGGEDGVTSEDDTGEPEPKDTEESEEDSGEDPEDTSESPEDTDETDDTGEGDEDADTDTSDPVACEAKDLPALTASGIAGGHSFQRPVFVTQPPGVQDTLYVVEQPGRILRVKDGEVQSPVFLDIRDRVHDAHNEQGLLGLAFHPDYQDNGRFFINYTPSGNNTDYNVVAEYQRESQDPDVASTDEVRRLVERPDNEGNHNGGMVAFGPDGYLYAAFGDGGRAGDRGEQHAPNGNGQTLSNVFGTLLRLDVDAPEQNFAPQSNPFFGDQGADTGVDTADDRIWAYGLRNPWRFSFDRKTGDIWIGDVGQNQYEEIDFEPASSDGGENYGWRGYEAKHVFDQSVADLIDDHHEPVYELPQGKEENVTLQHACSITGGYVYRGDAIPALRGYYLYGDFCANQVAAMRYCDGAIQDHKRLPGLSEFNGGLASFGEDNAGNLYLVYNSSGRVLKIESQ